MLESELKEKVSFYKDDLAQSLTARHTDKSRSSQYSDIGNLAVAIAILGK